MIFLSKYPNLKTRKKNFFGGGGGPLWTGRGAGWAGGWGLELVNFFKQSKSKKK